MNCNAPNRLPSFNMTEKVYVDKLKYDIIDHCNLNCLHCSHFSPYKPKKEVPLDRILSDLQKMKARFKMDEFRIFGGEPLLHTNIIGVMKACRDILGNEVKIVLLTNGLRLPQMKDSFFVAAKHYNILIELTEYPINLDFEKIETNLKLRGIEYVIRKTDTFYNFMDPEGKQDAVESFKQCIAYCTNTYFENDQIYLCSYAKSVPFVNEHFGYKIEHNSVSVDAPTEVIKKYLNEPCTTCRFCRAGKQPEPWTTVKRETL